MGKAAAPAPLPPLPLPVLLVQQFVVMLALVPAISMVPKASLWLTQAIGVCVSRHQWLWAALLSGVASVVSLPAFFVYVVGLALADGLLALLWRSAWGRRAGAVAVIFAVTLLAGMGSVAFWALMQVLPTVQGPS